MVIIAWLVLRIVFAWMFLYPLKGLLADWSGTVKLTQILVPIAAPMATLLMVLTMFLGALSILLGIGGQLAGLALLIYCLMGALVHYRLAKTAQKIQLSQQASGEDKHQLVQAVQLATVGHITSAQKNFVLAAVAFFFMLMGTGPYSVFPLYHFYF